MVRSRPGVQFSPSALNTRSLLQQENEMPRAPYLQEWLVRRDVVELARSCIGLSQYCRRSERCRPPQTVNCGVLVCYALDHNGFTTPKRDYQLLPELFRLGNKASILLPGDPVFIYDSSSSYRAEPEPGIFVNHVGIYSGDYTVIHAQRDRGVVEDTLHDFRRKSTCSLRGVSLFSLHNAPLLLS